MELDKIWNEPCLTTLKKFPDNSIDCIITSPPYYALRCYGTEPQIWDAKADCEHEWQEEYTSRPNGSGGQGTTDITYTEGQGSRYVGYKDRRTRSEWCIKCKAWKGELGLEPDFRDYIKHLVQIFAECHRVLKKTGTLWVNIADSYAGARNSNRNGATESLGGKVRGGGKFVIDKLLPKDIKLKQKSLMNIPARLAIVMTDELGFIQRNWCNWWKRSTMPSSAKDRFTIDNETVFFFTKSKKYYFEQQLEKAQTIQPRVTKMLHDSETNISVPYNRAGNTVIEGDDSQRNIRTTWDTYELNFEWPSETPSTTTWNVNTANGEKREVQHFAAFPTDLTERMIKAGCPVGGIVYDPFMGTGSTAVCAWRLGRSYIGSELLENYYIGSLKRLDELKAPGGIPQERLFR